ncbi:low temperature requirement protein A [Nocardioides anomalus]|uniref:Low temperature requirement protein A n=1 Tax=Nocardioides anomalus TaxID=2712223 RepID=A0A6G6WFQ9_9ACTN|nr:low temperature requirement protein A [Nocardioides anomalus]QIG44046.1 low temperature requirement protein A [Nocardioides anomalus]
MSEQQAQRREVAQVRSQLRDELRHRLRPMTGRDPDERSRSTTPLELLYDLTYVVAFAKAAEELAHQVELGHVGSALGAYGFAVFAISWAWMNFTWFTSAYGNDDALFRLATIVQMAGVVVLTFGLPLSFEDAAAGESPHNTVMLIGYVVMRVPLIFLWLRAARDDAEHRDTATAYAVVIALAQAGWVAVALLPLPVEVTVALVVAFAAAELAAPVVLERKLGRAPWNAGHVAERFSLLALITLGEVVAATTTAVAAVTSEDGWSAASVVVIASGLLLAAGFWWAYFLIPSRIVLEAYPERTFAWRYAHLPIFGSIAAVGAGLRVAAAAVHGGELSLFDVALALALPVAAVLLTIFVTWSVLMRTYDLSHVPLFLATLVPLGAALVAARVVGGDDPLNLEHGADLAGLVAVAALVALSAVVEVVGHEVVGYRHTAEVVEADPPAPSPSAA